MFCALPALPSRTSPAPEHPPFWGHIRKGGGQECPRTDKTNSVGKKTLPQSMENTFPAPCWKHKKRRWLIPSGWSCLRRAQVPPQPQHRCGVWPLGFWDTHPRLGFVTQAPQDTHTPWNNTRLYPSSLPWGVIHPCGRTAYPCQERWQDPEQASEQFSAWGRSPGPPWEQRRHFSLHRGWERWPECLELSIQAREPSWWWSQLDTRVD